MWRVCIVFVVSVLVLRLRLRLCATLTGQPPTHRLPCRGPIKPQIASDGAAGLLVLGGPGGSGIYQVRKPAHQRPPLHHQALTRTPGQPSEGHLNPKPTPPQPGPREASEMLPVQQAGQSLTPPSPGSPSESDRVPKPSPLDRPRRGNKTRGRLTETDLSPTVHSRSVFRKPPKSQSFHQHGPPSAS